MFQISFKIVFFLKKHSLRRYYLYHNLQWSPPSFSLGRGTLVVASLALISQNTEFIDLDVCKYEHLFSPKQVIFPDGEARGKYYLSSVNTFSHLPISKTMNCVSYRIRIGSSLQHEGSGHGFYCFLFDVGTVLLAIRIRENPTGGNYHANLYVPVARYHVYFLFLAITK